MFNFLKVNLAVLIVLVCLATILLGSSFFAAPSAYTLSAGTKNDCNSDWAPPDAPIATCKDSSGNLWFIISGATYADGVTWYIYKGTTMDNMVFQNSYRPQSNWTRPHGDDYWWCNALWIDTADSNKFYALMHREYNFGDISGTIPSRVMDLATSTNYGQTWTFVNTVISSDNTDDPNFWSGKAYWDQGPGDPYMYVDSNYFYVYYMSSYFQKSPETRYAGVRVARCAKSDKMASGKWYKYCNGSWDNAGLGGLDSDIFNENYSETGKVFYSTYLNKYVAITGSNSYDAPELFISTCTDLSTQNWDKSIYCLPASIACWYRTVLDPGTWSQDTMGSSSFRLYASSGNLVPLHWRTVTLTDASNPITKNPLYPPVAVADGDPGWAKTTVPTLIPPAGKLTVSAPTEDF